MHYGAIKPCDIANGLGVRVSLFVSGCRHRCQNCFNPETWAFRYGQPYTEETTQQILKMLEPSYIQGLSLFWPILKAVSGAVGVSRTSHFFRASS